MQTQEEGMRHIQDISVYIARTYILLEAALSNVKRKYRKNLN